MSRVLWVVGFAAFAAGVGCAYLLWGSTVEAPATTPARERAPHPMLVSRDAAVGATSAAAKSGALDSLREANAELEARVFRLSAELTRLKQAQSAGLATVRDAEGRRVFEYDAKNRVLTFDLSQSLVIPHEGKILMNRRDEIAQGRKSVVGAAEATLKFENERNEAVYLFWMDYNGNPIQYDHVKPGAISERGTHMGHVWVVTDMNGNVLGDIEPEVPNQTEVIPVK